MASSSSAFYYFEGAFVLQCLQCLSGASLHVSFNAPLHASLSPPLIPPLSFGPTPPDAPRLREDQKCQKRQKCYFLRHF